MPTTPGLAVCGLGFAGTREEALTVELTGVDLSRGGHEWRPVGTATAHGHVAAQLATRGHGTDVALQTVRAPGIVCTLGAFVGERGAATVWAAGCLAGVALHRALGSAGILIAPLRDPCPWLCCAAGAFFFTAFAISVGIVLLDLLDRLVHCCLQFVEARNCHAALSDQLHLRDDSVG